MIKGSHHSSESNAKNKIAHLGKRPSPATEFKKGMTNWAKGTKGIMKSNRTSFKPRGMKFKGTKGQYIYRHKKIYELFGKPDTCENCAKSGLSERLIHWANISGEYKLNRDDWKRLCVKCHWKMDKPL